MTEIEAQLRLHSALPREASFTFYYGRWTHSAFDDTGIRPEKLTCVHTQRWTVCIAQDEYTHAESQDDLATSVERALAHFAARAGAVKPPKFVAPSRTTAELASKVS
jgi:hypothetical protein